MSIALAGQIRHRGCMKFLCAQVAFFFCLFALAGAPAQAAPVQAVPQNAVPGDYVVAVHGLTWLKDTMKPAVKNLEAEGYQVVCFHYDSREPLQPDQLVEALHDLVTGNCQDSRRRIHFVGHSMGCILLRLYLAKERPKNLGRVVFMAPPNQGTALADFVSRSRLLQMIFGKGAPSLGTKADCLPAQLPSVDYSPGIIMGNRSGYFILSPFLKGDDDGVIPVESGRVAGMGDFVVVPTTHSVMPGAQVALRQVDNYLQKGKFLREEEAPSDLKTYALWKTGSRMADVPQQEPIRTGRPLLERLLGRKPATATR